MKITSIYIFFLLLLLFLLLLFHVNTYSTTITTTFILPLLPSFPLVPPQSADHVNPAGSEGRESGEGEMRGERERGG